jgi:hypothetical protein
MKWIGQHIWSLISRFRNDVYLEDVSSGTIASGGNLGLDSNNKIVKATVSSGSGDITAVTITTDSGGGSAASDTAGSADFSILGANGVGVTNSGTTITAAAVPGEIDHDSLNNFVSNEHIDWTASSAGTIHTSNYADTNTMGSGFTVSATTDSNATTITQGDDLMFTAGTGITCETTADGTVTITNTVSDTNTQLSDEQVQDIVGGMVTSNTETNITVTYQDADGTFDFAVPDASDSTKGVIEVAEGDEVADGTDSDKAVVPSTLKNNFPGSTSIGTLGTVTNGTWNGTKITDIYTNSSGRRFGSTIKILPSDFIANDEGSIGVAFDDDSNTGMVLEDTDSEMWAFVTIPEGMKATAVNIYSNNSARNFYVYEMDIDANGLGSSLGNNTLNSAVTGLSVDATATNFLAIKLDLSATNQRIRGGLVTIAAQ